MKKKVIFDIVAFLLLIACITIFALCVPTLHLDDISPSLVKTLVFFSVFLIVLIFAALNR